MYRRQESRPSQEKEMQKSKMAVSGGLTVKIAVKRREVKSKGEKERYTHLILGGIGGKRRRGRQRMRWLDGITD